MLIIAPQPVKALDSEALLSLVAMPLAVTAVAEIADVPPEPLFELVTLLNDARVPPEPFIEIVRYSPVALVAQSEPGFVEYLRLQTVEGTTGVPLVRLIENEYREYGLTGVNLLVEAPRIVEVRDDFVPVVVRQRVAERRGHPHGGPPGQLKKELGYQTGAEVVHGAARGKRDRDVESRSDRSKASKRDREIDGERSRGRGVERVEREHASRENDAKVNRREAPKGPKSPKAPKGNSGRDRNADGNPGKGKGKDKG